MFLPFLVISILYSTLSVLFSKGQRKWEACLLIFIPTMKFLHLLPKSLRIPIILLALSFTCFLRLFNTYHQHLYSDPNYIPPERLTN